LAPRRRASFAAPSIPDLKMPTATLLSIVEDDQILSAAIVDLVQSLGFSAAAFASAEEYLWTAFFQLHLV